MKIFIGTEDIAFYLSGLSLGLKRIGYDNTTFVSSKNKLGINSKYDIVESVNFFDGYYCNKVLDLLPYRISNYIISFARYIKFHRIIKEHDLFIFIWKPIITESYLFKRLIKNKKKIVCIHLGSDVRHYDSFCNEYNINKEDIPKEFFGSLNDKMQKIRYHELFADQIYSVPDQAGLLISPYYHVFLPVLNYEKIVYKVPNNIIPNIVHIPSNSKLKGTDIFIECLEKLKQEGLKFNFKLLKDIQHNEIHTFLTEADIVLDELYLNGPGMLGAEAMFAGCVVVTKSLNSFVFSPPIVSVDKETLYAKLKETIVNKEYRIQLAELARRFVLENNTPEKVAQKIISNLLTKDNEYDYYPKYYLESFTIDKEPLKQSTKYLTEQVLQKYNIDNSTIINMKDRNLL